MLWKETLSGQGFRNWLNSRIPGNRISQGQKLDPFTTSLRNLKNVSGWLETLRDDGELEARGGSGQQNATDLKSAQLVDDNGRLNNAGRLIIDSWSEANVNNNTDADELSRCIILLKKMLELNNEQYTGFFNFWKEVREVYDSVAAIQNHELLYLVSVLNSEFDEFNPWEIIKKLNLRFDPNENLGGLSDAFENINDEERTKLETLSTWLTNWRTRAKGRQIFCFAMELLASNSQRSTELLENNDLITIAGVGQEQIPVILALIEGFSANSSYSSGAEYLGPDNLILYGPPGSGKSFEAKQRRAGHYSETVTFHPGYDHQSFVGFYKPVTKEYEGNDGNTKVHVVYDFVPQAFSRIYVQAWKNPENTYFLVIEEINRGNCAKIFGDLFQLLDRSADSYSSYFINADSDFSKYLKESLENCDYSSRVTEVFSRINSNSVSLSDPYSVIILPANLKLISTMNTSDQSLFPMDSAFKRRWSWEYIPINYQDAAQFKIVIDGNEFKWDSFLKIVNKMIFEITESEDKQIGNRFVNSSDFIIDESLFKNKVLFYLWNDVFKDEDPEDENYFFKINEGEQTENVKFSEFFGSDSSSKILALLDNLAIERV